MGLNEELDRERERSRMEGMILAKLDSIEKKLDAMTQQNADIELRISALEAWRFKIIGASAVAGAVCSIAITYLTKYV